MKSGTAIGLLVGGAVLLMAAARPGAAAGQAGGTVYSNPGGALNPLNWFGQGAAGSTPQLSNPFAQTYMPAQNYQGMAAPAVTNSGGLLQPSYGGYSGGGSLQNIGYSPAYNGNGVYNIPGYSPYPVAGSNDATSYDYFPVMTPGGGFQDVTNLAPAANSQYMTAAASTPYQFYG